ncbi:hypothetical protein J4441_01155 [Candidatus Micrarchaeota archaeon]|nr:hypothetical protein [Candidatus Micrarchaeota archaeon]
MSPLTPAIDCLLEGISDQRSGAQKQMVIFSPIGGLSQLPLFLSQVKRLGLDKDADFIFICRQGLKFAGELPAVHAYERMPLGSSGCFFAGQMLAYSLGYNVVVVADLDAMLDSRETFDACAKIAAEGKAAVPLSKSPQESHALPNYAVVNQWGFFHRSIFESAGFEIPYTHKGAEDFEFRQRLLHARKLVLFQNGFVTHEKSGMGIYPKFANRKKYFPYVAGLMKAYLFCSSYSPSFYLRYVAWHCYYAFFADVFAQRQLLRLLANPFDLRVSSNLGDEPTIFTLQKQGNAGTLSTMFSLVPLMLFKKATAGGNEVGLSISRPKFAFLLTRATMLLPIRFAQGIFTLAAQKAKASKLIFPITPQNAQAAAEDYASLLRP